ncbi:MAG: YitT family protein [Bacteroidales bacterium]|nr:YitT family protein [Bacteroidales bacterium]
MKLIKELLIMIVGLLVGAAAVYYFLIPSKIVIGTVSGLAMVLNAMIPAIKVSHFVLMLNIVLVILAVLIVGKEFGMKSIMASIFLGPAMDLCEFIYPVSKLIEEGQTTVMGDPWFDLCCFVLMLSASQAFLFRINASTGGLDIVAMIMNKLMHIDIGTCVTFAGIAVCLTAIFIPGNSFRMVVIGIIGTWLNGLAIDYFMSSLNRRKRVCIVSKDYDRIRKYIIEELVRGCTLYEIKGGFTEEPGVEIQALLTQHEYGRLLEYIEKNHIHAFMTAGNCSEIHGQWFKSSTQRHMKHLEKKEKA